MKGLIEKFSLAIIFPLLLLTVGLSCTNNEDVSPPIIERVRLTDSIYADSSLVQAVPGTFLVLEGKNLENTNKVLFNGYEAFFNVAFNTNTHLFVQIPMKTPTPDQDPSVPNTITVITPAGLDSYDFAINPPPPIIKNIFNENTKPGDIMTIFGDFLLGVEEVVFPGQQNGTHLEKNAKGTELKVMVPQNLTETGTLILKSPYGDTAYPFLVGNTDGESVFANFEPGSPSEGWGYWGSIKTDDTTPFPNGYGTYLRSQFSGIGPNDGGWWTNNRVLNALNFGKVIVPQSELGNPPDKYYLKFEINTRMPITAAANFLLGFAFQDGNATITYYYVPAEKEPNKILDTHNQWKTISIPLSDIGISTIGEIMQGWGAIGNFQLGIVTRDGGGIENFDAAFDNFRIAKIQD